MVGFIGNNLSFTHLKMTKNNDYSSFAQANPCQSIEKLLSTVSIFEKIDIVNRNINNRRIDGDQTLTMKKAH
jgi:hypothetical protein